MCLNCLTTEIIVCSEVLLLVCLPEENLLTNSRLILGIRYVNLGDIFGLVIA